MRRKPKKRSTITTAVAIDRIDKMFPLILENARLAISLESEIHAGNDVIGSIRAASGHGVTFNGAASYNRVMNGVTLSLAVCLARLFDLGSRRMHPNRRDVASIPLLLRLLAQKRCQTVLSKRLSGETYVANEIDVAVAKFAAFRREQRGREAIETLKAFRDNMLAHSLLDVTLRNLPRFEHLFWLTDAAAEIVQHSRLAISGTNWDTAELRRLTRNEAKEFWQSAITGAIADERRQFARYQT